MDEEQTELEKIVLEEVTPEEFKSMQEFWKNSLPLREEDVCSRVINPLRFNVGDNRIDGYYRLICYLLEQKVAYSITVRDGKEWRRIFRSMSGDKSKLRRIAKIASQNPIKKNYLYIRLLSKSGGVSVPAIEFVEYRDQIIGYEVGVPFRYRNRFNIVTERTVSTQVEHLIQNLRTHIFVVSSIIIVVESCEIGAYLPVA